MKWIVKVCPGDHKHKQEKSITGRWHDVRVIQLELDQVSAGLQYIHVHLLQLLVYRCREEVGETMKLA